MKLENTIRVADNALQILWRDTTGNQLIASLALDQGVILTRSAGSHVHVRAGAMEHSWALENDREVGNFELLFVQALRRHRRFTSVARWLRLVVLYLIYPAIAVLIAAALNVAVSGHPASRFTATAPSARLMLPPGASGLEPTLPPPPAAAAPADAALTLAPAAMAKLLQQGASKGFAIPLSTGHKRTLYAFEDPMCIHCQQTMPFLKALAGKYNVVVFPVSVIGGDASAKIVSSLLCTKAHTGWATLWWNALSGVDPTAAPCDAGDKRVSANDVVFARSGLKYTPTFVSDNGVPVPVTIDFNEAAYTAWLEK